MELSPDRITNLPSTATLRFGGSLSLPIDNPRRMWDAYDYEYLFGEYVEVLYRLGVIETTVTFDILEVYDFVQPYVSHLPTFSYPWISLGKILLGDLKICTILLIQLAIESNLTWI